jgi:hypothetical protein
MSDYSLDIRPEVRNLRTPGKKFSQAGIVTECALIAFALALISPALSALTVGHIDPLDPLNSGVIGNWVRQLGALPLLVALIAIAVTARKAGWRSSFFNAAGAVVTIPVAIAPVVIITAAILVPTGEYPLSQDGINRRQFVDAKKACLAKQKGAPAVAPSVVTAYCTCLGTSMADVATKSDLDLGRLGPVKFNPIGLKCASQRWGTGAP